MDFFPSLKYLNSQQDILLLSSKVVLGVTLYKGRQEWKIVLASKRRRYSLGSNFFLSSPEDLFFHCSLEREEGREKLRFEREASISCLPYTPGLGIICAPPGIKPTTLQLWDNVPTEPPRAGLIIFICTCAHTNAHIQSKCHLFKNNFISKETCIWQAKTCQHCSSL